MADWNPKSLGAVPDWDPASLGAIPLDQRDFALDASLGQMNTTLRSSGRAKSVPVKPPLLDLELDSARKRRGQLSDAELEMQRIAPAAPDERFTVDRRKITEPFDPAGVDAGSRLNLRTTYEPVRLQSANQPPSPIDVERIDPESEYTFDHSPEGRSMLRAQGVDVPDLSGEEAYQMLRENDPNPVLFGPLQAGVGLGRYADSFDANLPDKGNASRAQAGTEFIGGLMQTATPLLGGALVNRPLQTLAYMAAGTAVQEATERAATALGATPEDAALYGTAAGAIPLSIGAIEGLGAPKGRGAKVAAETGRPPGKVVAYNAADGLPIVDMSEGSVSAAPAEQPAMPAGAEPQGVDPRLTGEYEPIDANLPESGRAAEVSGAEQNLAEHSNEIRDDVSSGQPLVAATPPEAAPPAVGGSEGAPTPTAVPDVPEQLHLNNPQHAELVAEAMDNRVSAKWLQKNGLGSIPDDAAVNLREQGVRFVVSETGRGSRMWLKVDPNDELPADAVDTKQSGLRFVKSEPKPEAMAAAASTSEAQVPKGKSLNGIFDRRPAFLKNEPRAATERLQAIREAQAKELPSIKDEPQRKAALTRVYRSLKRNLYDKFSDIRRVSEDLKKRGIEIPEAEDPGYVLDLAYGGLGGHLEATAIEFENLVKKAESDKLLGPLRDYLNLKAYQRAFATLSEREGAAYERLQRENFNKRGAMPGAGPRAAEAAAELESIQERVRAGKVVPGYRDAADVQAELEKLEAVHGDRAVKIKALADELFQMHTDSLRRAADAGLISKSMHEMLKARGAEYVPLHRIFETIEQTDTRKQHGSKVVGVGKQDVVNKFEGSARVNIDPLQASLDQIVKVDRQIQLSNAARAVVKTLSKAAEQKIVDLKFLEKGKKDYFMRKNGADEPLDVNVTVPRDYGTISYYENGQRVTYIAPKLLTDALTITSDPPSLLRTVLQVPRDLLRVGATGANYAFMLRNVQKDNYSLYLESKASPNSWNPLKHARYARLWVESLADVLAKNERYRNDFLRSGASQSTFMKQINSREVVKVEAKTMHDKFDEALRRVSVPISATEEATKFAALKTLREKGVPEIEAVIETRRYGGSPDFAKRGARGRDFDLVVMFFNAGVQGAARSIKRGGGVMINPRMWLAATVATGAMYQYNTGAQFTDATGTREWDKISDYDKKGNWIILRPETYQTSDGQIRHYVFKVPKPQVIGAFFNSLELALDGAVTGRVDYVQAALDNVSAFIPGQVNLKKGDLIGSSLDSLGASANPLIKVPFELGSNRNYLTGSPIVPHGLQKLPREMQTTAKVSPTAEWLANRLGQSPLKVQHAIRGFTAGVGEQVLALTDLALEQKRDRRRLEGDESIASTPFFGLFVRQFVGTTFNEVESAKVNRFYGYFDDAEQAFNVAKELSDTDREAAKRYLANPRNRFFAGLFTELQSNQASDLASIRRLEKRLNADKNLSPAEFKQKMRKLHDDKMKVVEMSVDAIDKQLARLRAGAGAATTKKTQKPAWDPAALGAVPAQ